VRLVRFGHSLAEALSLTPRQIVSLLGEHARQERAECAQLLSLHAMAARGEPKEVQKMHKELLEDGQRTGRP
jgi:hypothetical protein